MNNTTIVTALYDINRGSWENYKRTFNEYCDYFNNVLSLKSNIVIFCDEANLDRIKSIRLKWDTDFSNTRIITQSFKELECYKLFYERIKVVMQSDFFKQNINDGTPESLYPEYNIINLNKVSFLAKTIELNPFKTEYFIWMDAGFWHSNFPSEYRNILYPDQSKIKILDDNKVNFLSFCDEKMIVLDSYFSPRVSLAGSMFAGKEKPLLKFKEECFKVIDEFLNNNAINDDQAIYSFVYKNNKDLLSFYRGNWFENFKAFI